MGASTVPTSWAPALLQVTRPSIQTETVGMLITTVGWYQHIWAAWRNWNAREPLCQRRADAAAVSAMASGSQHRTMRAISHRIAFSLSVSRTRI